MARARRTEPLRAGRGARSVSCVAGTGRARPHYRGVSLWLRAVVWPTSSTAGFPWTLGFHRDMLRYRPNPSTVSGVTGKGSGLSTTE